MGEIRLIDTGILKVYPGLLADIAQVSRDKTTIKEILEVRAGGSTMATVVVVLTPTALETSPNSGDVHIAIHPLAIADD